MEIRTVVRFFVVDFCVITKLEEYKEVIKSMVRIVANDQIIRNTKKLFEEKFDFRKSGSFGQNLEELFRRRLLRHFVVDDKSDQGTLEHCGENEES